MVSKKIGILLLVVLLITTLSLYLLESNTPLSKYNLSITLSIVSGALVVFGLCKEDIDLLKSNFLKISTMFIIGFVLVHFFEYLAYIVGEHEKIIDIEYIDSNYVNEAALCSCACLIVFLIGYLYENKPFKNVTIKRKHNKFLLEWLMLLCLIVFYYSAGSHYFHGGYGDVLNNIGLSLPAILSQTLLQASQITIAIVVIHNSNIKLTIKEYVNQYSFIYYVTLTIYTYLVISSGDRGPLFQVGICYITPFFIINKSKLKLLPAVFLISGAALFFALLGTVRAMDGDLSITKIENAQKFRSQRFEGNNVIFTSTAELSNVVRAYHVLYYYSKEYGYIYGLGFGNQLLGIIPGLRLLIYPLFGIDDKEVTTAIITTKLLNKDHGMGSTCVGDTFFNFGLIGTLIIFFVFGMFVRKMDLSSFINIGSINPFWSCTIITYFMFAIYIGRGYLSSPINLLAYSYALYCLNSLKK